MSANTAPIFPSTPVSTVNNLYAANTNKDGSFAPTLFSSPAGSCLLNGILYVCDKSNNRIRAINTSTNVVETFFGQGSAGSADGFGLNASFNAPQAICTDGEFLYVGEQSSFKIRKLNVQTREVSTIAGTGTTGAVDGIGNIATIGAISGLTFLNGVLYLADSTNYIIRSIKLSTLEVTIIAGVAGAPGYVEGFGTSARVRPNSITNDGQYLYVSDSTTGSILKIDIDSTLVSTFTGNNTQTAQSVPDVNFSQHAASYNAPNDVVFDGTYYYVADTSNHCIRKIDIANNVVTTPYGVGLTSGYVNGTGAESRFNTPNGLFLNDSDLYVADSGNNCIRKIDLVTGVVSTFAGTAVSGLYNAQTASATFNAPQCVVKTEDGTFFIADTANNVIRKISSAGDVTTIAGSGGIGRNDTKTGLAAQFCYPTGLAYNEITKELYVADSGNNVIRIVKTNTADFEVSTLTGTGSVGSTDSTFQSSTFYTPNKLAFDASSRLFVSDSFSNKIRIIDFNTGLVSTLAGTGSAGNTDAIGTAAVLNNPTGLFYYDNSIYFTDLKNNAIKFCNILTTSVGSISSNNANPGFSDGNLNSNAVQISNAGAVCGDARYMYFVNNYRIQRFDSVTNIVDTIVGTGVVGSKDGPGESALIGAVSYMELDGVGNLWFSDTGISAIRKVQLVGLNMVSTIAGNGASYSDGAGLAIQAEVNNVQKMCTDGLYVYFVDSNNNKIRKFDVVSGVVSTVAGTGEVGSTDGALLIATFNMPYGICIDSTNKLLFVSDTFNNKIRVINLTTNIVSTIAGTGENSFADGTGLASMFSMPKGLVYLNGDVFVADTGNNRIRKLKNTTDIWATTTLSGNGNLYTTAVDSSSISNYEKYFVDGLTGSTSTFYAPSDIVHDGVYLYVADTNNNRIRKVSTTDGSTSTIAGNFNAGATNGIGALASFNHPSALSIDESFSTLFVADTGNNKIRTVSLATFLVSNYAGSGTVGTADNATGTSATMKAPCGVVFAKQGNAVYFADTGNNKIRKILTTGARAVSSVVGTGISGSEDGIGVYSAATLATIAAVVLDEKNDNLYFTDNNTVRVVQNKNGIVKTFAGDTSSGYADGPALGINAAFNAPTNIVLDSTATSAYIADMTNHVIRKIEISTGNTTTIAGTGSAGFVNGEGTVASFSSPVSVAISADNKKLYVADNGNFAIRVIELKNNRVTTVAGFGSTGYVDDFSKNAKFASIGQLALSKTDTNILFVADTGNHCIRKVNIATGLVSTYAGKGTVSGNFDGFCSGTQSQFSGARGVVINSTAMYIADTSNNRIRKLLFSTGEVTTVAGSGSADFVDGANGALTSFNQPRGLVLSSNGLTLFVSDFGNHAIRRVTISTGQTDTVVGSLPINKGGSGATAGYTDSPIGTDARLNGPSDVIIDRDGDKLIIAETTGNRIRISNMASSFGTSTLVGSTGSSVGTAGGNDAVGTTATLNGPLGLIQDTLSAEGTIYFSDSVGYTVRRITTPYQTPTVFTIAGSYGTTATTDNVTGSSARFKGPGKPIIDSTSTYLFVGDVGAIRRVQITAPYSVVTVVGTGTAGLVDGFGTAATVGANPVYGAYQASTNSIFIADAAKIRNFEINSGSVSSYAGTTAAFAEGLRLISTFNSPAGVVCDASGVLYVSDTGNNRLRRITSNGVETEHIVGQKFGVAGTNDGIDGALATFNIVTNSKATAQNITSIDTSIFVADGILGVKRILPSGVVDLITQRKAYSITASEDTLFVLVKGAVYSYSGENYSTETLIVGDEIGIGITTGIGALAALKTEGTINGGTITYIGSNTLVFIVQDGTMGHYGTINLLTSTFTYALGAVAGSKNYGFISTKDELALQGGLRGLAKYTSTENIIADATSVKKYNTVTGVVTPIAGTANSGQNDATGNLATFSSITDIVVIDDTIYVADTTSIRAVGILTGAVTTIIGGSTAGYVDGVGTAAKFSTISQLCYVPNDGLYILDKGNFTLRKATLVDNNVISVLGNGAATVSSGEGVSAGLGAPTAFTYSAKDNAFFFCCTDATIRTFSIGTNVFSLYAGTPGSAGSTNSTLSLSTFSTTMAGILVSQTSDDIYIADTGNTRIRLIKRDFNIGYNNGVNEPLGKVITISGATSASASGYMNSIYLSAAMTKYVAFDTDCFYMVANNGFYKYDISTRFITPINHLFTTTGGSAFIETVITKATLNNMSTVRNFSAINGKMYYFDGLKHTINALNPSTKEIKILVGCYESAITNKLGAAYSATFNESVSIANDCGSLLAKSETAFIVFGAPYIYNIDLAQDINDIIAGSSNTQTDGFGTVSSIREVTGLTYNVAQNTVYFADIYSSSVTYIRTLDVVNKYVETYAGGAQYVGTGLPSIGVRRTPMFTTPGYLAFNDSLGSLYISENGASYKIRKYTISTNTLDSTIGNGTNGSNCSTGLNTTISNSCYVSFVKTGKVYFAERATNSIKVYDEGTKFTSIFSGAAGAAYVEGKAAIAKFSGPQALLVDDSGDVFVADTGNNRIRKISNGVVSTLCGTGYTGYNDGAAGVAVIHGPQAMCWNADKTVLYVTDATYRVRKIEKSTGKVSTIAGNGTGAAITEGIGENASLGVITALCFFENALYIGEFYSPTSGIRKITLEDNLVSNYVGHSGTAGFAQGVGTAARFKTYIYGMFVTDSRIMYITDYSSHIIRTLDLTTGTVAWVSGQSPSDAAASTVYPGSTNGHNSSALFNYPKGITGTKDAGVLYVVDMNNYTIRKIVTQNQFDVFVHAGSTGTSALKDGVNSIAYLNTPMQFCFDGAGSMFIADSGNNRIRKLNLATGYLSTIVGDGTAGDVDGTGWAFTANGSIARVSAPYGIIFDGSHLLVSTSSGNKIRKIEPNTGKTWTLSGTGTATQIDSTAVSTTFKTPKYLVFGKNKNSLLVLDGTTVTKLRQVDVANGNTSTYLNTSSKANTYMDGVVYSATFGNSTVLVGKILNSNDILVMDGNYVRKITLGNNKITTLLGFGTYTGSGKSNGMCPMFTGTSNMIVKYLSGKMLAGDRKRLRQVNSDGSVITLAGVNGPDAVSTNVYNKIENLMFGNIASLVYDPAGQDIFVIDSSMNNISKIDIPTGNVTLIAGSNVGTAGYADDTTKVVFTAGPNGSRLDTFKVRPTGASSATVVRFFLNTNGQDIRVKENNTIIAEISVAASTLSETTAQTETFYYPALSIPANAKVFATLGTATTNGPNAPISVSVFGGDY